MAKANLGADAAKAVFLRSPPVGLSVQVSHNGSYVTEKMFAVRKHGASFSPHGAMASSLAPPTPGAPVA